MDFTSKIAFLCLFLMLASFGVEVDAGGHGMMGGLFGGGGGKHGGPGGIETLLAAGLLARLLRGGQGGLGFGRSVGADAAGRTNPHHEAAPIHYGLGLEHVFGL